MSSRIREEGASLFEPGKEIAARKRKGETQRTDDCCCGQRYMREQWDEDPYGTVEDSEDHECERKESICRIIKERELITDLLPSSTLSYSAARAAIV